MARLSDTILQGAYADQDGALTINLERGGQFGYNPKLGIIDADGRVKAEWIANKAYLKRNVIPILVEAPRFFSLMPNPERWVRSLKSLVETHVRNIDGLNATLTVETADHPIGGGGEMMREVADVKREQTNVTMTFTEKEGRSISRLLQKWIQYGIKDPETKYSLLATLGDLASDVDMLPDWYTMTMLFIEPDAMHRKVLHAWLVGNMFPTTSGEITGRFDKTAADELVELSVEMGGFSQYNLGVTQFAQSILDKIKLVNANPYLKPAFVDQVDPEVDASEVGYKQDIDNLAASIG